MRLTNLWPALATAAVAAAALAASTTVDATAADAPAALPVHPASGQPAPGARHSGHLVPGLVGPALRRALPAYVSRHFMALNTSLRSPAPAAPRSRAASRLAGLPSWTGAFHGAWGVGPQGVTLTGAQATQSLNPSARVVTGPSGNSDVIYAPTLDPSGITCIEMTTIYASGQVQVGAWDWCAQSPTFVKVAVVDSAFLATYARHNAYSVQDVQTNPATNQWTAYLFNHRTNAWDTFYQSANTIKLTNSGGGWDMMEVYTYYNPATGQGQYCTQARLMFQTTGLQYQTSPGGNWTPATPGNSVTGPLVPQPSLLGCSQLNYAVTRTNSAFSVTNVHRIGQITGFHGLCVDDRFSSTQNFNPVQIYTCNGTNAQRWTVNNDTIQALGKCLDIQGGGTANGTTVDLYDCNGTGAQVWQPRADKSLYNPQSGKCLDDTNWSTTPGTQLQIWDCASGQANQQWTLPG